MLLLNQRPQLAAAHQHHPPQNQNRLPPQELARQLGGNGRRNAECGGGKHSGWPVD